MKKCVTIVTNHITIVICVGSFRGSLKIETKTIKRSVTMVVDTKQGQQILLMLLKQQMQ